MKDLDIIRSRIVEKVVKKLPAEKNKTLNYESSLIASGLYDSIDFISLLIELESEYGFSIDFEDADPTSFTSINGLAKLLSEKNV